MKILNLYLLLFLNSSVIAIGQEIKPVTFERCFIHTDRDAFIAGENLYFKAYIVDNSTLRPTTSSKFAYIVLRDQSNVYIAKGSIKLDNGKAFGSLYLPDTLCTGKYQLICFTNAMRNVGESCYFKKEILVANRFDKELTRLNSRPYFVPDSTFKDITYFQKDTTRLVVGFIAPKTVFEQREKVKLGLEALGILNGDIANISISVSEYIPTIDSKRVSISNYLMERLEITPKANLFPQEGRGVVVQGKVKNSIDKKELANEIVYLSTVDSITNLLYATTDKSGMFRFLLNDYYKGKELIFKVKDNNQSTIEIDNKFNLIEKFDPSPTDAFPELKTYLRNSQDIVRVQKTYFVDTQKEPIAGKVNTNLYPMIYHKGASVIYPSEYEELPDFAEIALELVPDLKLRRRGDSYNAYFLNNTDNNLYKESPAIFLDGVMIEDINQVIQLGSKQIKKIETYNSSRIYGDLKFSGILSIMSNKNEINKIHRDSSILHVPPVKDISASYYDYSQFSSISTRFSNPRQLLYWEPNLTLQAKEVKYIEFPASDKMGDFIVAVEGITTNGTKISSSMHIKVKLNPLPSYEK